jgi:DNA recombination protein RmuC
VDEKLQGTLEKRLGQSFQLVSERLELVHKGLGEMQTLAAGCGRPQEGADQREKRGGPGARCNWSGFWSRFSPLTSS